ncbi:MAG: hypothetical protein R3B71_02610 [Candidatus Gracilibacteria bacterium]|nr:hypothetical protein [Candidatus Peregrinibacteria bacterium]
MIEDKIALALKQIAKLKMELRDLKKDVKYEEKLDTPEYLELKGGLQNLKKQVKAMEEEWMNELKQEEGYNKLREMVSNKEEEIARANQALFKHISELPQKPFQMKVDNEAGPMQVDIMPEMRLYLNGKEEKRRAAA